MCRQYWNDVLIEESLEERHLVSNVEKHVQDIKVCCWCIDFKEAVEVGLHSLSDTIVSGYVCCICIRCYYNN